jgi:hypothetical protein
MMKVANIWIYVNFQELKWQTFHKTFIEQRIFWSYLYIYKGETYFSLLHSFEW